MQDIPKKIRDSVLKRDNFTCQMCGASKGEPHHDDNGRITRLRILRVITKNVKDTNTNDPLYLRTVCSLCYEGASKLTFLTVNRPDAIKLLSQIRRAPAKDQLDVLQWLIRKFPKQTEEIIRN
jgi:hypothetical protein